MQNKSHKLRTTPEVFIRRKKVSSLFKSLNVIFVTKQFKEYLR